MQYVGGTEIVFMFLLSFYEKEKQFREYRDSSWLVFYKMSIDSKKNTTYYNNIMYIVSENYTGVTFVLRYNKILFSIAIYQYNIQEC
jgi:hypothetical protein